MNNYNPLFNTMNMTRNISPFATAGSSAINTISQATRGGLLSKIGTSKITLSGILNNAQKTIGTVNQIVPLYNQVKPLFQNSKILLNVAKSIKGDGSQSKGLFRSKRKNYTHYEPTTNQKKEIDENIIDIKEKKDSKKNENTPSKPFFII